MFGESSILRKCDTSNDDMRERLKVLLEKEKLLERVRKEYDVVKKAEMEAVRKVSLVEEELRKCRGEKEEMKERLIRMDKEKTELEFEMAKKSERGELSCKLGNDEELRRFKRENEEMKKRLSVLEDERKKIELKMLEKSESGIMRDEELRRFRRENEEMKERLSVLEEERKKFELRKLDKLEREELRGCRRENEEMKGRLRILEEERKSESGIMGMRLGRDEELKRCQRENQAMKLRLTVLEEERKKMEYELVEKSERGELRSKLVVEDELRRCRRENEEMKETVCRLQEKERFIGNREKRNEERYKRLLQDLEECEADKKRVILETDEKIKRLSMGKLRAEAEAEGWKKRYVDLDVRVSRVEEKARVLQQGVDLGGGMGEKVEGKVRENVVKQEELTEEDLVNPRTGGVQISQSAAGIPVISVV